jgi:hypothetical protein
LADAAAQTAGTIVDRLAAAPLLELAPLAELLDRLDPDPGLRSVAGAALAERLRASEPERILHAAGALRTLRPAPGLRAEAADVLRTKLGSTSDEKLRAAIAPAVLWFVDRGPAHDAATDALIGAVATADVSVLQVVKEWARSDDATPVQRSRAFTAFLELLRDQRVPGVGSDLVELAGDGAERADAVTVLLERTRRDPATHPGDWLEPAAALGATREQLEEANDWVIAALPEMDLHQGSCYELRAIWRTTPPTDEQAARAARHLVNLLASDRPTYVDDVVRLLKQLAPARRLWEEAKTAVRRRMGGEGADHYFATRAMQVLEPGYGEPTPSERLAALAEDFDLGRAARLLRDAPEETIRRGIIDLLVSSAKAGHDYVFRTDEVERLADDLGVTTDDIAPMEATAFGALESLRALARSARRRCDGEAWRAFLRDQFDRDPSSAQLRAG